MDRDINNRMGIGSNTNSYKKNATSAAAMVIGIHILLILSAIAISSSSVFTAQLVYSQGPPMRQQQQQQDPNDLIFQLLTSL
jgi:hypothetical protein